MKLQLKTKQVIEYLPKRELAKQFPLAEYPSVSAVLKDKPSAWLKAQYKDKNSTISKACRQGTRTHKALESGETKDALTAASLRAFEQNILIDLDEIWGQEEWVAHSLGYKGKFDGIGIYRGKLTLFDHKKTNTRKTRSQLVGYFKQLAAYKQAHEFLYTQHKIEQVAIFNIFGKTVNEVDTKVTTLSLEEIASFTFEFNRRLS